MIKEELKKSLTEESQKRFVATMEFYVWAPTESEAKMSADEVMALVRNKYDNDASITDLVSQEFGQMGHTKLENISEDESIHDVDKYITDVIALYKEIGSSATDISDFMDSSLEKMSPPQILKLMKNKKLKNLFISYFELEKELNSFPKDIQLQVAKRLADRYSEVYQMSDSELDIDSASSKGMSTHPRDME